MKKVIVVCLAAVLTAGIAMAGEGKGHKGQDFFVKADTDKDGKLSLAEFTAAGKTEAVFKDADADHDGFLTPEELKAYHQAHKPAKKAKAQ